MISLNQSYILTFFLIGRRPLLAQYYCSVQFGSNIAKYKYTIYFKIKQIVFQFIAKKV